MGLPVIIVDADPSWPDHFATHRDELEIAAGQHFDRIEHVGSTAVPGLAAKPIIDVMIGVADLELLDVSAELSSATCGPEGILPAGPRHHVDMVHAINARGYEYLGFHGIPERLYWRRYDVEPGIHIHMVSSDSPFWHRHVLFRDYLRAHPDEAAAYAQLKQQLAREHPNDRDAYTDAKTEFITTRERRAAAWRATTGDPR